MFFRPVHVFDHLLVIDISFVFDMRCTQLSRKAMKGFAASSRHLDPNDGGGPSGSKRQRDENQSASMVSRRHTAVLEHFESESAPPARLSRHIPQREEMNMCVSSFNLTQKALGASVTLSNENSCLSYADSFHSDDSSFVSSLYCERLADTLAHGTTAKLGGDVLRFRSEKTINERTISSCKLDKATPAVAKSRVLSKNPDRVLDAPELPSFPSAQLLHWGTNNKLVIGLRTTLYCWDAETLQAQKALSIPDNLMIRCVQWVHRCLGIAITATDGTTAILDTKSGSYVRTLRPPEGTVSQIAVEGAILAAGSNSASGNIYLFDLRARDALVIQHEGHRGRIASLHYCTQEPHYLASGGVDGCVKVWDARKPGSPRYSFPNIHTGAVTAVCWNPDRRTTLFSGGDDRLLQLLDTHGCVSQENVNQRPYLLKSVASTQPVSGILCPSGSGEVATSHTGVGQIQLRKISTFQQLGVFSAPGCTAGISCVALAPDKERVCAAQQDETLKFWKVFDASGESKFRAGVSTDTLFDDDLR